MRLNITRERPRIADFDLDQRRVCLALSLETERPLKTRKSRPAHSVAAAGGLRRSLLWISGCGRAPVIKR